MFYDSSYKNAYISYWTEISKSRFDFVRERKGDKITTKKISEVIYVPLIGKYGYSK